MFLCAGRNSFSAIVIFDYLLYGLVRDLCRMVSVGVGKFTVVQVRVPNRCDGFFIQNRNRFYVLELTIYPVLLSCISSNIVSLVFSYFVSLVVMRTARLI